MNKGLLYKKILDLERQAIRLTSDLSALKQTDFSIYPENYICIAGTATRRSESITESLRTIVPVFKTNNLRQNNTANCSVVNLKIEIRNSGNSMTIIMPGLTPTRAFNHKSNFVAEPLFHALACYVEKNQLPKHKNSVVIFTHLYNGSLSHRRVRDYDNLECKNMLDVVSLFALPDDNGTCCEVLQRTEFSTRDATRIDVVNREDFASWYMKLSQKSYP